MQTVERLLREVLGPEGFQQSEVGPTLDWLVPNQAALSRLLEAGHHLRLAGSVPMQLAWGRPGDPTP